MPTSDPAVLWLMLAAVAATLAATFFAARVWPGPQPALPLEHVAAAALVGVIGWEALINLPSTYVILFLRYAGISDAPGQLGDQALVVVATAYVVASAVAIVGVLRRRAWGVVLAVAVCIGRVMTGVTSTVAWLNLVGGFDASDPNYLLTILSFALGVVPALVAIGLLAWPFIRAPGEAARLERQAPAS